MVVVAGVMSAIRIPLLDSYVFGLALACFAVSLIVGTLSHLYVELPLMRLFRDQGKEQGKENKRD